jgi:hypothetical protein
MALFLVTCGFTCAPFPKPEGGVEYAKRKPDPRDFQGTWRLPASNSSRPEYARSEVRLAEDGTFTATAMPLREVSSDDDPGNAHNLPDTNNGTGCWDIQRHRDWWCLRLQFRRVNGRKYTKTGWLWIQPDSGSERMLLLHPWLSRNSPEDYLTKAAAAGK